MGQPHEGRQSGRKGCWQRGRKAGAEVCRAGIAPSDTLHDCMCNPTMQKRQTFDCCAPSLKQNRSRAYEQLSVSAHSIIHVLQVAKDRRLAEKKAARSKGKPSDGGRSPGGDSSADGGLGVRRGGVSQGGAGRWGCLRA